MIAGCFHRSRLISPAWIKPPTLWPIVLVALLWQLSILCLGGWAQGAAPAVLISEFLAENTGSLRDDEGDSPDWIELHNPGPATVSLAGWFLTDNQTRPAKWKLPATNLVAGARLVLFASGKNRATTGGNWHANFKLAAGGGYLALVRPDGVTTEHAFTYSRQRANVSCGLSGEPGSRQPGPGTPLRFFPTPTPGTPNDAGVAGLVSDPQFEPRAGLHFAPFDARIRTGTPGATLVYTRDGTAPSLTNGVVVSGASATARVETTTILRATAFKEGWAPSALKTASHLFPADVPRQERPATVAAHWPGGFPAAFGLDARVITNALPGHGLTNGLLAIPSLSLVMPPNDLWGAAHGIYANPMVDGDRAASMEMLFPDGRAGWQMNGGAGIRGYSSQYKSLTPKHSFTLVFRKKYGGGTLAFPVFEDSPRNEFKALVLRENEVDSWANSEQDWNKLIDGEMRWYRARASYVRDQWMRDTQLALGSPAAHGRFVQLYLNGFYWGLYNLTERLDEHFAANYFGGRAADYDVVADSNAKAGNLQAWSQLMSLAGKGLANHTNYQRLLGHDTDGRRDPKLPVLLDVESLVDYMILHIHAGADDWPWHNWVATRDRGPASTGFKFLAWDQELAINSLAKQHTDLGQLYAEVNAPNTPAYIYARCRANAEFRQLFADRLQRHLFNGGALTVRSNIARYNTRVAEIGRAVVPESARWGAFYRFSQPYLREVEWLENNQWMRQSFFPSNHTIALNRFRAAGLFPPIDAPVFNQFGGPVPAGFALALTDPGGHGTVYFTTDGADPRQPGGKAGPTARPYTGPVAIHTRTLARARVLQGTTWSALVETVFEPR